MWNAGLSDNAVDYIFAKREYPIAIFLADKLFNFYVHEEPTRAQLDQFAAVIASNNFNILNSVRWLLVQDFMYSNESMNSVMYANPLELAIGLFRVLHASTGNHGADTRLLDDYEIIWRLGWTPYIPWSIFGRDGFDVNKKWMNPHILTQWSNFATTVAHDYTRSGSYVVDNIAPVTASGWVPITMDQFIDQVEGNLLLWRALPLSIRNTIKNFLTRNETGAPIVFNPTSASYRSLKYPGVYSLVLSQPEFMLKSGYDISEVTTPSEPTHLDTATGTLIVIELPGWYDWMHWFIQKDDYNDFVDFRNNGTNNLATSLSDLVDLGDYYMNRWLAYSGGVEANGMWLKRLYDEWYLKLFNRVGVPNHSRDHDMAQFQVASMTTSKDGWKWILWALSEFEDDSTRVVIMGNRQPNIVQGWNYINLGPWDNRLQHSNPGWRLSTGERDQVVNMIMNTFTGRTYPWRTGLNYMNSIIVHDIANLSVSQWWQAWVGWTTRTQLNFLEVLLNNNLGQAFYLQNTGNGYDTHADQLIGSSNLNTWINPFISSLTSFFLSVKDTHNVTIVVFSEFGRTNKVNGTDGTDHGNGGGSIVISSNPQVLDSMSGSHIYGKLRMGKERDDWLSSGIDQRALYGRIFDAIYGIPEWTFFPGFTRTLDQELSLDPAVAPLLHTTYRTMHDNRAMPVVRFKLDGDNYNYEKGSYATFRYFVDWGWRKFIWNFKERVVDWDYRDYNRLSDEQKDSEGYHVVDTTDYDSFWDVWSTSNEWSAFSYVVTPITDQYVESAYTGTNTIPIVEEWDINSVRPNAHTILRRYNNTLVGSSGISIAGSGILLSTGAINFPDQWNLRMRTTGATYITNLTSPNISRTWNWAVLIGERMNNPGFIPREARLEWENIPLSNFNISNIVRFGSDVLWVGMQLSQPVELLIGWATPYNQYHVFMTDDGYSWDRHTTTPIVANGSWQVVFDTNHLSLFALAEAGSLPACSIGAQSSIVSNGSSLNLNWSTFDATSVSISQWVWVVGFSWSISVIPVINANTTYVLTATNAQGSSTCQVTVQAMSPPSCTLSASSNLVKNGTQVSLSWTGTSAVTSVLQPFWTTVPSSANMVVSPPATTTTSYILSVSNPVWTNTCSTTISTYPNTAPVAHDDTVNVAQNGGAVFPVLENDTDLDVLDIVSIASIVDLPSHGITSIAGSGILYTPTPAYCGADSFTYRASDQDGGLSNIATVTINVSCGTNLPVTVDSAFSGDEDTPIIWTLTWTDLDGDILNYVLVTDVLHWELVLNTNWSFVYTPDDDYFGIDNFTYYATDWALTWAISTVTLTIHSVNDLPAANPDIANTNQDTATYIDVFANDTDVDHHRSMFTISINPPPWSGSVIQIGELLYYTPNPGHCGTDVFWYMITDGSGGLSNSTTVSIDIACAIIDSSPPIAVADVVVMDEDSWVQIDFISNDTDSDFATGSDMISFHQFVTLPSHWTISVTTSGSSTENRSNEVFIYTPNTDYCGSDTFTYTIRDIDMNISNTAPVSITINCINDAPVVIDIIRTGYSDVIYTGTLTATDSDSTIFTYQIVSPESLLYGTATVMPDGNYTYIPSSGSTGINDVLYYTATDSLGLTSNTGSITFNLMSPPAIVVYMGDNIVSTGSANILSGVTLIEWEVLSLNNRSIASISSGSTGSIVLPGSIDMLVESWTWTWVILAPEILDVDDIRRISLGDPGVIWALPADTQSMTYSYAPADTFKAWSDTAALALTGGYATIEFVVQTPGVVFGSRLQVLRSQDGIMWEANQPDTFCIVDNELKCTFRTNHLTYFGTIHQISSPVVQVASSIRGWGGYYGGGTYPPGGTVPGLATSSENGNAVHVPRQNRPQLYITWIEFNQSRYPNSYLINRVYWDILRKNKTNKERTEMVQSLIRESQGKGANITRVTKGVEKLWSIQQRKIYRANPQKK